MRTKTRLWTGGLADIVQRAKQQLPESAFITREQELSAQEALISESKIADEGEKTVDAPDPRLLPPRPPLFGRSTLMGHAFDPSATRDGSSSGAPKRPEMRATRLVPIESLLPPPDAAVAPPASAAAEPSVEAPVAEEPATSPAPSVPAKLRFRPSGEQVRRGLMVLLALAAAVLFALPKPQPAPALPKVAETAPDRAAEPTTPIEATAEREHAAVSAGNLPAEASVTPRQAVDALASGDYTRAERLYVQLAQAAEDGAVYAEAARILEERIRTRSY